MHCSGAKKKGRKGWWSSIQSASSNGWAQLVSMPHCFPLVGNKIRDTLLRNVVLSAYTVPHDLSLLVHCHTYCVIAGKTYHIFCGRWYTRYTRAHARAE